MLNIIKIANNANNKIKKEIGEILNLYQTYGNDLEQGANIDGENFYIKFKGVEVKKSNSNEILNKEKELISNSMKTFISQYIDNNTEHKNFIESLNKKEINLIENYLTQKFIDLDENISDIYENLDLDKTLILANKDKDFGLLNMDLFLAKKEYRTVKPELLQNYLKRDVIDPIVYKNILKTKINDFDKINLYKNLREEQKTRAIDLQTVLEYLPIDNVYDNKFYIQAFNIDPYIVKNHKYNNFPTDFTILSEIAKDNVENLSYFYDTSITPVLLKNILDTQPQNFHKVFEFSPDGNDLGWGSTNTREFNTNDSLYKNIIKEYLELNLPNKKELPKDCIPKELLGLYENKDTVIKKKNKKEDIDIG